MCGLLVDTRAAIPYFFPVWPLRKALTDWELLVQLQEYAALDLIALGVAARDKEDLLQKLVQLLLSMRAGARQRRVDGRVAQTRERMTRDRRRIAIPHALTDDIEPLALVFGRTPGTHGFQALDSRPSISFHAVGPKSMFRAST